jgi:hypothetical protein
MSSDCAARTYVTNDFIPQFIDQSSTVPVTINFNTAKNAKGITFCPINDILTINDSGIYLMQFSLQVFNATNNPTNPLVKFELRKNGATIVDSQTTFNAEGFDTIYTTSTLVSEHLTKCDQIQLVLSSPKPIPAGLVLRIDFASLTIFKIGQSENKTSSCCSSHFASKGSLFKNNRKRSWL